MDLKAAKERASNLPRAKYEMYVKAETVFFMRHQHFVQSLTGRAKQIYDGIFSDEVQLREYKRRASCKQTNYVYRLLENELRNPWTREELKGRFNRMQQHPIPVQGRVGCTVAPGSFCDSSIQCGGYVVLVAALCLAS